MNIRGIHKTSLIDFPGRISTVLFTGGCNLRCRYCHNPGLVCGWDDLRLTSNEEVIEILKKRIHVIDGVTISGGEPTLSRGILPFLEQVKALSLEVKIDTNGLNPAALRRIIEGRLVDYVAIDLKTSPGKYQDLTGAAVDFSAIRESIDLVRDSGTSYEIRTTCVPGYVTLEDFELIRAAIGRVARYALQQFNPGVPLIDHSCEDIEPYPIETLQRFRELVLTFADECEIRGL